MFMNMYMTFLVNNQLCQRLTPAFFAWHTLYMMIIHLHINVNQGCHLNVLTQNTPSTFKTCITMSNGSHSPASPASAIASPSLECLTESLTENNLGPFPMNQVASESASFSTTPVMEMATLDSGQEVLLSPGPDVCKYNLPLFLL